MVTDPLASADQPQRRRGAGFPDPHLSKTYLLNQSHLRELESWWV